MGTRRSLAVGLVVAALLCACRRRVARRHGSPPPPGSTGRAGRRAPEPCRLAQVRRPRRLRHRRPRRSIRSPSRWRSCARASPSSSCITVGDNIYGGERPQDMKTQVRGPVQAAARRRREVLRLARQPRRSRAGPLQAVQHGRPDLLHLQGAEAGRAVLRARDRLPDAGAGRVAREGAGQRQARTGRFPTSTIRSTRRASATDRTPTWRRCSSRSS